MEILNKMVTRLVGTLLVYRGTQIANLFAAFHRNFVVEFSSFRPDGKWAFSTSKEQIRCSSTVNGALLRVTRQSAGEFLTQGNSLQEGFYVSC